MVLVRLASLTWMSGQRVRVSSCLLTRCLARRTRQSERVEGFGLEGDAIAGF